MDLVSPHPFWLLKNGLLGEYPSLKEDVKCDVVVLGAGISGAFVADRLAQSGLKIVVVDKRDVAAGSTSASTALLQYEIDTSLTKLTAMIGLRDAQRAYRACHNSIDIVERLVDELAVECTFQRKRSAYFAVKKSETESLRRECAARQAAGIVVDFLDEAEVSAWFSFSRPAALISTQAAEIDCHRLAHALLKRAVKAGARVYDRTCAAEIETAPGGVRLKTDRGCVITARDAVFATGYESQQYVPSHVVTLKSTYALASEPLKEFPGWWERCLIWETARPYLYLRTTADGRAMIGGEDDPFRNPGRRDRLVDKRTDRLASRFREMFPKIELIVDYRWAGTFGETKDGLAYIGQIRQMPRCHFALGFGGNGITYSVIAADIIHATLAGRTHPDAHLFTFDR